MAEAPTATNEAIRFRNDAGTRNALPRSASMKEQRQPQTGVILFSTAAFVAMLLADLLKAAEVPPVYVIFLGVVLSVGLSLIVTLELIIDRLARPKR